ncbi:Sodium/potassium-transporting ATPase subunit beta-1-interacting protein [Trichinella pseudospiralis]|uniref:Sodium/potassium-transporting ATPase subunit beta-1-interacting protein n=2 Tax=Trichinella pseudospiralis TaxID=6337 RepID=A0A0V1DUR5_TRIPS|nr:Sodium/potassium-transporting ATPase subunit beta-1-interacting protein [Trichinella pseudospiralis]KRY83731.1 Sodium/potassium-transporting ATPase subunit beta-1-interacting protein [Trichinella pseudospiralis]KRZ23190.1 Sodium/potassium-transporting ATPase subunit beta-1-interacting protein [Trichinella pseudospiralis]KRZ35533.1 Sodium/potassium-transporting ATPase subunit beta-1-interacting protein [Trichinella pseudospiralis]
MQSLLPSRRRAFIILSVNLLLTVVREVFDFMSYLWFPILVTFVNVLNCVVSFFGVFQYRTGLLYASLCWIPVWIAWNIFLACFYCNVGSLDRVEDLLVLNWGTQARSWWFSHTPSCKFHYDQITGNMIVNDCIIPYYVIEVIIAVVHCLSSFAVVVFISLFLYKLRRCRQSRKCATNPSVTVQMASNQQASSGPELNIGRPVSTVGVSNRSYESDESMEMSCAGTKHLIVPNYRRHAEGARMLKKDVPKRYVDRLRGSGDLVSYGGSAMTIDGRSDTGQVCLDQRSPASTNQIRSSDGLTTGHYNGPFSKQPPPPVSPLHDRWPTAGGPNVTPKGIIV